MVGAIHKVPIAQKLVFMALTVSAVAMIVAVACLAALDLLRYRTSARAETDTLAQVIAENTAAAVVFGDTQAASETLSSLAVLPMIRRACVYGAEGGVLAAYSPSGDGMCPSDPAEVNDWQAVSSRADVTRNNRTVGVVYVERSVADMRRRIGIALGAGALVLAVGGVLAFLLASRLQRTISTPIMQLAGAARAVGENHLYEAPEIKVSGDEVGELVNAFSEMVKRLRETHAERERLLAREREASRLKDEFLAAVSHELRTPLNAILGWVQILTSMPASPDMTKKALASLERNAEAQKHVIEDLLDVSRIITGKLQMKMGEIDLRSPLEAAVEVVTPMADAKQLEFKVALPHTPCAVHGDRDRLRQVFWNLLSNAVKFTPAGGTVEVSLSASGDHYAITVADTGAGITPGFLPHVFERFRQADGSMTREHGGLGLGLAIAKELTELHGGSIVAESAGAARGSRFTVTLPRLPQAPAERRRERSRRDERPSLEGMRILTVDDDADTLDVIAAVVGAAGATVDAVQTAQAAIASWQRGPYDAVLCDLAMPQMDGFELLKRIRGLERGGDARVIAVTAFASDEYRAQCLRAGFDDYVPKPIDATRLLYAIRRSPATA